VTNTDDRPDLSSEGALDIDKTVNVKQKLISDHETQMGLDTKTTRRLIVGRNVTLTLKETKQKYKEAKDKTRQFVSSGQ
jgi:hypothetical protein